MSVCLSAIVSSELLLQPFNGLFSRTTRVSRYQKGRTNLDFTGARDSELQWHQLGHMQVCTLLQTDNHASTPPLGFLQAGCPSCRPTNSVKALTMATLYAESIYATVGSPSVRLSRRSMWQLIYASISAGRSRAQTAASIMSLGSINTDL